MKKIETNGGGEVKKAKTKDKKKYSIFLVTINTNMVPNEDLEELFDTSIEHIFKDHLIDFLVDKTEGRFSRNPVNPADILEHSGQAGIEIGEKQHRLHAHVVLKITHKTKLHVDKPATEDFYKKVFGKKFYVHVDGTGNDEEKMKDYATKNYKEGEKIKML